MLKYLLYIKMSYNIINSGQYVHKTYTGSLNEIDVLFRLKSPYIVHGNSIQSDGYLIEAVNGSIEDLIIISKKIPIMNIQYKYIATQLAMGLRHLHRSGYSSINITSENCLYKRINNDNIKFQAMIYPDFTGDDLSYKSPECIFDESIKNENIWSLGIVFLEMFTSSKLFDNLTKEEIIDFILQLNVNNYNLDDEWTDLLNNMLNLDPKYRYTIEDVIDHPAMKNFKIECAKLFGDRVEYNKVSNRSIDNISMELLLYIKNLTDSIMDIDTYTIALELIMNVISVKHDIGKILLKQYFLNCIIIAKSLISKENIEFNDIVIDIIKLMNGILKDKNINITNKDELEVIKKYIFNSPKSFINYYNHNYAQLFTDLRSNPDKNLIDYSKAGLIYLLELLSLSTWPNIYHPINKMDIRILGLSIEFYLEWVHDNIASRYIIIYCEQAAINAIMKSIEYLNISNDFNIKSNDMDYEVHEYLALNSITLDDWRENYKIYILDIENLDDMLAKIKYLEKRKGDRKFIMIRDLLK